MNLINRKIGSLADIMETQGELFGADLKKIGVPFYDPERLYSRDTLCIQRRRSLVLTNPQLIGREKGRRDERSLRGVTKEERKHEETALKLMRKEDAVAKKLRLLENKAQKDIDKVQKDLEKVQRDLEKTQKKQEKEREGSTQCLESILEKM